MSWFPRYNRFGALTWEEPGFWQRQWFNDSLLIWQDGTHTRINGEIVGPAFTKLGAGGGRWRGSTPDHSDPAYSFSGRHCWIENPQSNEKRLMLEGVSEPIAVGPIIEVRISDTCLAWKQGSDVYAHANGETKLIARGAGWPVPVDTPDGPWVVMMRGGGVWIVPFADPSRGFVLDTGGQSFYPDAVCIGREIRVAFTDVGGRLSEPRFSLDAPRVPWPAPKPEEPKPSQPTPEPEPLPMPEIHDQTATVASVRSRFPTPLGAQHGACLMEIARAIGNGAGLLRKESGTHIVLLTGDRVSQDIICFPDGRIYDCLSDAEGAASPSWQDKGFVDARLYFSVGAAPRPQEPDPDPGDVTQPAPSGDLGRRVAALEERVSKMERAGLIVAQVYRP